MIPIARCTCWTCATRWSSGPATGRAAATRPAANWCKATDTWVGVRNARIVLIDDTGVRARMAAAWLRQMGHRDVFVVEGGLEAVKATGTPLP